MPIRAKVFKTGGSQAVRLPKEFRFEGDEVEISRQGQRVVLEPVRKVWSDQFRLLHGSMPDFKLPPEPAPAEAVPDFD